MVSMELVSVIRHKVLTEGVPIRDVARQLGLSRNTIRRYVRAKVVPVPRPPSPPRPAPARVETILQKREASIMRSAGDRGAASRLAHGVEAA
jgi:transposase